MNLTISILLAVQVQQSWAYTNKVNLLAANANRPTAGASGSGIYNGKAGIMSTFVSEVPITKVLKAKLKKNSDLMENDMLDQAEHITSVDENVHSVHFGANKKNYLNLWKEDLTEYSIQFLDFTKNTTQIGEVCNSGICCKYIVEVSDNGPRSNYVINFLFKKYLIFNEMFLLLINIFH